MTHRSRGRHNARDIGASPVVRIVGGDLPVGSDGVDHAQIVILVDAGHGETVCVCAHAPALAGVIREAGGQNHRLPHVIEVAVPGRVRGEAPGPRGKVDRWWLADGRANADHLVIYDRHVEDLGVVTRGGVPPAISRCPAIVVRGPARGGLAHEQLGSREGLRVLRPIRRPDVIGRGHREVGVRDVVVHLAKGSAGGVKRDHSVIGTGHGSAHIEQAIIRPAMQAHDPEIPKEPAGLVLWGIPARAAVGRHPQAVPFGIGAAT